MSESTGNQNQARGSLLGLAVGDALGTTLEFKRMPETPWERLLTGPHNNVTGGGPFQVLPGQVTDDTMMASCLIRSLHDNEGLDLDDVAVRYVDWQRVTFDCGSLTGSSLSRLRSGSSALESGKEAWLQSSKKSAGNGSLMRTAPIGVFFAGDLLSTVSASLFDSGITHFDPRCSLACAAYNAAVGDAVSSAKCDPMSMLVAARQGLFIGAGMLFNRTPEFSEEIERAMRDLEGDLLLAEARNPELYGPELHIQSMQGFVRVGFRLAFWELLHAPDYKAGLLDTVNRGGDADTNGAISGGLLGAAFGEESIPKGWRDVVLNCQPPEPFGKAGTLHPAGMMTAIESL